MASGALQTLIDKYATWTPGSGYRQLPAWQPDNLNDPSAAMFGFGPPHVYWQNPDGSGGGGFIGPPPPPSGGGSEDSSGGLSAPGGFGGSQDAAQGQGGGGIGTGPVGYGLGAGSGSLGGAGSSSGASDYQNSDAYLSGLERANGLSSGGFDWSSLMPSTSTLGGVIGGLAGGPLGAILGSIAGSALGTSKTGKQLDSTMSQGAMGVSIPSDPTGGSTFTPDGSDPAAGHPVDSTGFTDGGGYVDAGGGSSQGSSSGNSGNGFSGVFDLSSGMGFSGNSFGGGGFWHQHPDSVSAAASGGSVAKIISRPFGKFMAGPMQTDPRTAKFAAELKQAMTEVAGAVKGPQAARVKAFFQANYVEPVEQALARKDVIGAMKLCVAMLNEARSIAQGAKP